jgi:hypothetical protein
MFEAAARGGVARVVHVSIANPSLESTLPYYRGKALVERALREVGIPHSIVRPTWVFGGERDVLANNIAWILRRMPIFALPGSGRYPVQPVHVDDFARICHESAVAERDVVVDAAGPETMSFEELVRAVRRAVRARSPIVHLPPALMAAAARALGVLVRDVVLTPDEISGLTAGLLASHEAPRGRIAFSEWARAEQRRGRPRLRQRAAAPLRRRRSSTTSAAVVRSGSSMRQRVREFRAGADRRVAAAVSTRGVSILCGISATTRSFTVVAVR